jgi:rhodanese-related sulfurtransferase
MGLCEGRVRPPSYIFGWLGIGLLIFAGSFVAGRAVNQTAADASTPELVRAATVVEDTRSVTASQVLDAYHGAAANQPLIIDVRTSAEFAAAHVSGAVNIQDFQLPDTITTLPRDHAWVLYCTCPDDRLARWGVAAIQRAGYVNGLVLRQGLQGWQEAGGPITTQRGVAATKAEAFLPP